MNNKKKNIYLPVILVFILLNGIVSIFRKSLQIHGFDPDVLIVANLLLFLLSLGGFFLQRKGINSNNANAFVRGVYSSIIIKLFVCMIAVMIYAFIERSNVNKPSLFVSMGMYIVYTSIEVALLTKAIRKKNA